MQNWDVMIGGFVALSGVILLIVKAVIYQQNKVVGSLCDQMNQERKRLDRETDSRERVCLVAQELTRDSAKAAQLAAEAARDGVRQNTTEHEKLCRVLEANTETMQAMAKKLNGSIS